MIICPNIFPSIFLINTIAKLERSKNVVERIYCFLLMDEIAVGLWKQKISISNFPAIKQLDNFSSHFLLIYSRKLAKIKSAKWKSAPKGNVTFFWQFFAHQINVRPNPYFLHIKLKIGNIAFIIFI